MTKQEFIKLVQDKCSDEELDFLRDLSDTIKIYSFVSGQKNYPQLETDEIPLFRKLLDGRRKHTNVSFIDKPKKVKKFTTTRLKTRSENIQNVYRSMTITVAYFSSNIFGYVSSTLDATLSYEYDLISHRVLSAGSIICDVNSSGISIDGLFFDWVDAGSNLAASSDGQGLTYCVSGDVIVGKSFGGFPAGFVVEEIRGKCGETLVPWD